MSAPQVPGPGAPDGQVARYAQYVARLSQLPQLRALWPAGPDGTPTAWDQLARLIQAALDGEELDGFDTAILPGPANVATIAVLSVATGAWRDSYLRLLREEEERARTRLHTVLYLLCHQRERAGPGVEVSLRYRSGAEHSVAVREPGKWVATFRVDGVMVGIAEGETVALPMEAYLGFRDRARALVVERAGVVVV